MRRSSGRAMTWPMCVALLAVTMATLTMAQWEGKGNINDRGEKYFNRFLDPREVYLPNLGNVRGFAAPYAYKKEVNLFLGVPYARKPDENYRFKPPEVPQWYGTWDATYYRPLCPQDRKYLTGKLHANVFDKMSEDCLYLDIYAPNDTQLDSAPRKYPVIVFLHDGDFLGGSARYYNGLVLARYNVMVVSVSYRVGALGFLSTLDDFSWGNYGLMDVFKALTFIRDNIGNFGGNEKEITLVGHGAGAALAALLLVVPRTDVTLFHKMILMGGSDTSEWAVMSKQWEPRYYAYRLARLVGCPAPDWTGYDEWNVNYMAYHERMLECLRYDRKWQEIVQATSNLTRLWGSPVGPFSPSVDYADGWIPMMPAEYRKANTYRTVPMIGGVCKDDGAYFVKDLAIPMIDYGIDDATLSTQLKINFVDNRRARNERAVLDALVFQYTWWANPDNSTARRQMLIDIFSDSRYGTGTDSAVKDNVKREPKSFFYEFGYKSDTDSLPYWMGVPHGKDLENVLGFAFFNSTMFEYTAINPPLNPFNLRDQNISDYMMQMWANFAWHTNASYVVVGQEFPPRNFTWREYDLKNCTYAYLDEISFNRTYYRQPFYGFWKDYWWKLLEIYPVTSTVPPTPAAMVHYTISTYTLLCSVIILIVVTGFMCWSKRRTKLDILEDLDYQAFHEEQQATEQDTPPARKASEGAYTGFGGSEYAESERAAPVQAYPGYSYPVAPSRPVYTSGRHSPTGDTMATNVSGFSSRQAYAASDV